MSPYLLTNLAACGCCGDALRVRTRSHGQTRAKFYGCAGYHDRGVCSNNADIPMADADAIAAGGEISGLLDGLKAREATLTALKSELETIAQPRAAHAFDARRARDELQAIAREWRQVLTEGPGHARPIIAKLLTGRVTLQPLEGRQ
jgi:hypothetical protein